MIKICMCQFYFYLAWCVEPQGDLQNEIVLKFKASAGSNQWNIRSQKQIGLFMSPASPSPSSCKTRMQINQFHSNFSYKNVCKQPLNVEWQAPKEFGRACFWRSRFVRRLKQNCNWESCFLWLLPCSLNWEQWLFLVLSFLLCVHCYLSLWYTPVLQGALVNSGQTD